MSKPDGGPAFPLTIHDRDSGGEWGPRWQESGMTLRDWFAGRALEGLLANPAIVQAIAAHHAETGDGNLAGAAYWHADRMIEERER